MRLRRLAAGPESNLFRDPVERVLYHIDLFNDVAEDVHELISIAKDVHELTPVIYHDYLLTNDIIFTGARDPTFCIFIIDVETHYWVQGGVAPPC